MSSLTDTGENRTLDWATGNTVTAPVLPLMVRLVIANGSDSAAGTECPAGTGYAPQSVAFAAASGGATSNTGVVNFGVLDASASRVIAGFEVWDSAGTPVRWWWAPLTGGDKTVGAGEQCQFAAGDLDLTQS